MIQLVSSTEEQPQPDELEEDENTRKSLLNRIKSIRKFSNSVSNGSVRNGSGARNLGSRSSTGNSSIISGHFHSDLRRREVVLAKISLYMVFVFLICHSVKIVPNVYEMVQTYLTVSLIYFSKIKS